MKELVRCMGSPLFCCRENVQDGIRRFLTKCWLRIRDFFFGGGGMDCHNKSLIDGRKETESLWFAHLVFPPPFRQIIVTTDFCLQHTACRCGFTLNSSVILHLFCLCRKCFFSFGTTAPPPPQWDGVPFTRFLDHKQQRTTVGRTPLDEWSFRHRDLTWQHTTVTTDRHSCPPWDSNPQSQ